VVVCLWHWHEEVGEAAAGADVNGGLMAPVAFQMDQTSQKGPIQRSRLVAELLATAMLAAETTTLDQYFTKFCHRRNLFAERKTSAAGPAARTVNREKPSCRTRLVQRLVRRPQVPDNEVSCVLFFSPPFFS
jgi:hypothetical protein